MVQQAGKVANNLNCAYKINNMQNNRSLALTFYQTPDTQRGTKPANKTGTTMTNDEENLKTNQPASEGKSVSAAPTSNQPERPHTVTDNPQIHVIHPTLANLVAPVNTSPIISPSPPHHDSPSELYKTDDLMDVDVDNSLGKKTATSDSSELYKTDDPMDVNVDNSHEKKTVSTTSDSIINGAAKLPGPSSESNATSFNEKEGREKRRLQTDGKKEDDNKRQRKTVSDPPLSPRRVGVGASTLASRKLNQKVNNGTFKLSSTKWNNFKEKITFLDRNVSFPDPHGAPRSVRHSKCGRIVQMKEPYNVANFETHLKTCRSNKTAGMPTLESLFNKQPKMLEKTVLSAPTKRAVPPLPEPCPGLTETDHPEIPKYLKRSPACGGGAPSLDTIASQFGKKTFSKLSPAQQQKAWSSQRAQLRWYNDVKFGRVFSSACTKSSHLLKPQRPCDQCSALLDDKGFRQALSLPIPAPEKVRFTPKHWINTKAIELWGDIHGVRPLVEAYDKV
jgi:hypothetical protein